MMENHILIDCNDMKTEEILKAAMVNAVTRISKGAGRKERSDLLKFIIECAKAIESFQKQKKNQEIFQENMQQQLQQTN